MAYKNNMNPMKVMIAMIFAAAIVSMTLTGCKNACQQNMSMFQ